jgi:hypothetical protein
MAFVQCKFWNFSICNTIKFALLLLNSGRSNLTWQIVFSCRDGSVSGYGIRIASSQKGSDSWVDDPITRHVISLQLDKNVEGAPPFLLWPLVLHIKGQYHILVLPLVEPYHLMMYEKICQRDDCGNPNEVKKNSFTGESLSSLLLDLPCITGYGEFFIILCWTCLLSVQKHRSISILSFMLPWVQ